MSADAPVVWLDEGEAKSDAVRALDEWARARGIHLVAPAEASANRPDPQLSEHIEKEIERAIEAIGAADADKADRALARAEALLREHPELLQAAWLRAEVERTWSSRWLRVEPRDEARARAAWENADALDGGRVPGIGETPFPAQARVGNTIIVSGGGDRLALRVDGLPLEPTEHDSRGNAYFRFDAAPTEHHVVVMAGSAVVFASWIAMAGAEPPPTRLVIDDSAACRREQFTDVHREGDLVSAHGVACPRWLAAASGEKRGSVSVARCQGDTCGPLLEWRLEGYGTSPIPAAHESDKQRAKWPAWATWTLVGAGVVVAASVAIIASGALEARPVVPRFVVGGARTE